MAVKTNKSAAFNSKRRSINFATPNKEIPLRALRFKQVPIPLLEMAVETSSIAALGKAVHKVLDTEPDNSPHTTLRAVAAALYYRNVDPYHGRTLSWDKPRTKRCLVIHLHDTNYTLRAIEYDMLGRKHARQHIFIFI